MKAKTKITKKATVKRGTGVKKTKHLYAYISVANKRYIDKQAKIGGLRKSQFVDFVLNAARKGNITVSATGA